uniref:THAP-type domain-containing protein n=1 Tax=Salarias fasciatus TaxID=181472 RepID=A0A672HZR3_SALFA
MVGQYCCVKSCSSRSHDRSGNKVDHGIRFFSFPKWKKNEGPQVEDITRRRRIAWVAAVRRKDLTFRRIPGHMRVCSLHFQSGQPSYEMQETHPDWTPSLLLGHNEVKAHNKERFERQVRRTKSQRERTVEVAEDSEVHREEECIQEVRGRPQHQVGDWALQMEEGSQKQNDLEQEENRAPQEASAMAHPDDHCEEDCEMCQSRCDEINRLLEENRFLKQKLAQREMTEEFLRCDDNQVKFYTGLVNYDTLNVLLCHVVPFLPQGKRKLSPFQMVLITLMHLRLDLPLQHIAHLFGVHRGTVSAIVQETINVLHVRLAPLVHWPDRDSLQVSMPHQFVETFGKRVAAIIDCFEVFIKRPSNLLARAQTFSHYKHSHTLKYLIGITPQGVISFISKGWGGRTSDKKITENCGFLDQLLPGDLVLADRGFDIQESVGMMCAEVKTPAFTRGQRQLDAKDVEETRSLASLRIHVERVIGAVRNKYKILSSKIPIEMVLPCEGEEITFLDKVVVVCCALTNMCPSVVL